MDSVPKPRPPRPGPPNPKPSPKSVEACQRKVYYSTEALAEEAVVRRMLSTAEVHLYYYPCPNCPGFHLTSDDGESHNAPSTTARALDFSSALGIRLSKGQDKGAFVHTRLKRRRRSRAALRDRRRRREGDESVLPKPRLATDEEIREFFATGRRPGSADHELPDTEQA